MRPLLSLLSIALVVILSGCIQHPSSPSGGSAPEAVRAGKPLAQADQPDTRKPGLVVENCSSCGRVQIKVTGADGQTLSHLRVLLAEPVETLQPGWEQRVETRYPEAAKFVSAEIGPVPAGSYILAVGTDRYKMQSVPVAVKPGATAQQEFTLSPGTSLPTQILGRVLKQGKPEVGALVQCELTHFFPGENGAGHATSTNQQGEFSVAIAGVPSIVKCKARGLNGSAMTILTTVSTEGQVIRRDIQVP